MVTLLIQRCDVEVQAFLHGIIAILTSKKKSAKSIKGKANDESSLTIFLANWVPCRTSVIGLYYRIIIRLVLPHPPYSPDIKPPDFDLFPKLKQPKRGHRFSSLKELFAAVARAFHHINKDGVLDEIAKLSTR